MSAPKHVPFLLSCVQISGFWLLSSLVQNSTHSHNCTRQRGVKWFQHRLVRRLHSAKMGKQDTSSPLPQSRQNYDISFSSLPAGICQFLCICCLGLSVGKDGGGGPLITHRLKSSIILHRKRFMLIGQLPGLFIKVNYLPSLKHINETNLRILLSSQWFIVSFDILWS